MRIFIADFETYWSTTHSLTKMNPIAYVLHPETEIISLAIKELGKPDTFVYFGEDNIRTLCEKTDWSDVMLVGHNMSGFDAMIFAWRFGVKPRMWGCTLSMARPFYGLTVGGSLKKVSEALALGAKGNLEATNTKGKHLSQFTPDEIAAVREYNKQDVALCEGIFKKLAKKTPLKELRHIDMVTRMLVEPQFNIDVPLLKNTLQAEQERKQLVLLDLATMLGTYHAGMEPEEAADAVSKTLGSAAKFSHLLKDLGVEAPTKISPTTGKPTPALAKTDEGFLALQNHPDPIVAAAAQARLGVKSTLLESRISSFLEVAEATGGKMPVPQQYYAAHTGRNGGGGASLNLCNLPRVSAKPSDALRNSLVAPPGYKVVVADLSGIELRVNMTLWKVPYAMEAFKADRANADLYKSLASEVLCVPIENMPKMVRQAGKAMHLGCIAEGELVLTDHGLIPIEKVLTCMLVWDGVEWVQHEGPIYQGEQEVITYDSLTATPDHIVYLRDGSPCRFDKAANEGLEIAHTGHGGKATRVGESLDGRIDPEERAPLPSSSMHGMFTGKDSRTAQPETRHDARVPEMQPAEAGAKMARSADHGDEAAMHESKRPRVQKLWRSGDSVSVPVSLGGWLVGYGTPRVAQALGTGSGGQQRALRTGELAVGDRPDADCEPPNHNREGASVLPAEGQISGGSLRGQHCEELIEDPIGGRGSRPMAQREIVQTKRRVWDLLNAGPRHRFTVAGRLVSNCGYGLKNRKKYIAVAKSMAQITVTEEEAELHIDGYSRKHPELSGKTNGGWARCGYGLQAILKGTEYIVDPWGLVRTDGEGFVLPSGRKIRYPGLRLEHDEERGRPSLVYGEGRNRARIYGAKADENIVQALSRDIFKDNLLAIYESTGVRYAHEVYDEAVYVVPEDKAEAHLAEVLRVMRTPPSWWPELLVWAEGDIADSYGAAK